LLAIVGGRTYRDRDLSQIAPAGRRTAETAEKGMKTTAILPRAERVKVPGGRRM
jgi:hypothetical protein